MIIIGDSLTSDIKGGKLAVCFFMCPSYFVENLTDNLTDVNVGRIMKRLFTVIFLIDSGSIE